MPTAPAQRRGGTLLDLFPFGMVVNIKGAKTCLSWDAVRVVELVED
jgi:hypothetical protein